MRQGTVQHTTNGLIQEHHQRFDEHYFRVIKARLPLHLSLFTWQAYKYSLQDVRNSLMCFDTRTCLNCMRTICPPSATGPNLSHNTVTFCSKAVIVDRVLEAVGPLLSGNTRSVLTSNHFIHKPCLPVVELTRHLFSTCQEMLMPLSMLTCNHHSHFFTWLTRRFIMVEQLDSEILGYRIVPVEDFDRSMRYHPHSPITHSAHVIIGGERYVCTEEAVIFRLLLADNPEEHHPS